MTKHPHDNQHQEYLKRYMNPCWNLVSVELFASGEIKASGWDSYSETWTEIKPKQQDNKDIPLFYLRLVQALMNNWLVYGPTRQFKARNKKETNYTCFRFKPKEKLNE